MAASIAQTAAPKVAVTKPTTVVIDPNYVPKDKDGKAKKGAEPTMTVNVCPQDNPYGGLSAGVNKWSRVFGVDKDGDNVLFEVLKALLGQASPEAKAELVKNALKFAELVTSM